MKGISYTVTEKNQPSQEAVYNFNKAIHQLTKKFCLEKLQDQKAR